MKTIIAVIMLVALCGISGTSYASVVINEIYYDPINSENGGEAIELYNNGNLSVDISGYIIKTKSSSVDATLPQNSMIGAKSFFLIADAGFSTLKDDPSWPNADYEEAITLTNSDGGVALLYNDQIIDSVGWGNQNNIPSDLYEENPANQTTQGLSLQRKIDGADTDDNLLDFSVALPTLRNSLYAGNNGATLNGTIANNTQIPVSITVIDMKPKIKNLNLTDDNPSEPGFQVLPFPGSIRRVFVNAAISNNSVKPITKIWAEIEEKEFEFNLSLKTTLNVSDAIYQGNFTMDFFDDDKNYTLILHAENSGNFSNHVESDFAYLPMIAMQTDGSSLECVAAQDRECINLGDNDVQTKDKITIRNLGNVKIDFILSPGNISSGSEIFPIENIKYSFSTDLINIKTLSSGSSFNDANLLPGLNSLLPLSFKIQVPENQEEGEYTGKINLFAVRD